MSKYSINRKAVRVEQAGTFNSNETTLYRIMKDYRGEIINVYQHTFNEDMTALMNDGKNHHNTKGTLVGEHKVKTGWTLKNTADMYRGF
tara:strand:- start:179 stop:445 length:267 start_codon:yes stop_codon:yes gene_type:complete